MHTYLTLYTTQNLLQVIFETYKNIFRLKKLHNLFITLLIYTNYHQELLQEPTQLSARICNIVKTHYFLIKTRNVNLLLISIPVTALQTNRVNSKRSPKTSFPSNYFYSSGRRIPDKDLNNDLKMQSHWRVNFAFNSRLAILWKAFGHWALVT